MATIRMTREEYQKKYGVPPPAPQRVTTPATQPTEAPQEKKNIIQKVGGFLGIEKFAKGIGEAANSLSYDPRETATQDTQSSDMLIKQAKKLLQGDPRRRELLLKAQGISKGSAQTAQEYAQDLPTNKEVIGSAANVGLNVLAPGAFRGGKVAQVAKNTALGAGFGVAGGLNENKDLGGVAKSTALGAGIGGAIPLAGSGLSRVKQFFTEKLPENLMNRAVKPTLDELRKNIKYGSDTLGRELLQEGVSGNPEQLLKIADSKLAAFEDDLQNVLNSAHLQGARIDRKSIASAMRDLIRQHEKVPGNSANVERIKKIYADLPKQMTLPEANEIKRAIYQDLRNPGYKLDAKLSADAATKKAIAKGLKEEIEKQTGGTIVKEINRKLSLYGRLEDRVVDQMARDLRNRGISLTDWIVGAGGFATGNPLGAISAVGLKHIGESGAVMTKTAQGLSKFKNIGTGVTAKTAKGLGKRALLNVP